MSFNDLNNKYKTELINYIKSIIDVSKLDTIIDELPFEVPSNFDNCIYYDKLSSIGSKYFFLVNEFHTERLSDDDKMVIENNTINEDFLKRTLKDVIKEMGDITNMGPAMPEYFVPSDALVFAFYYDRIDTTMKQSAEIITKFDEVYKLVSNIVSSHLDIKVAKVVYNGFEKQI